jgi:hypothetical protein
MLMHIFRAVEESGADVGGNTELLILGKAKVQALLYPDEKQEYLWRMNTGALCSRRTGHSSLSMLREYFACCGMNSMLLRLPFGGLC